MDELSVGDTLHGFTLTGRSELPEQNGTGLRFRHDATGLDLYHVFNDDPENLFAIMVKTPPKNNSGTPHIIEHAVLSGSRKYRTKEPFLSLMKGSANTFLNAMTYPDKTVYPAASPVKKDYFNMFSVYADAVFFPLLRRETFKQEGVRLAVDERSRLSYDGIVFNEMKGAYADHDSIVSERSVRALFPDTPYGFDSGGVPEDITRLTYEEFSGYHAEFYHPSNCRIFLYGNIPTEKQLEFLESGYLKEFTQIKLSSEVGEPKLWDRPKNLEFTSPLNVGESPAGKSTITVNWWACGVMQPLDVLTLEVLVEALLGNPGAPLYKAIIESGYGSDIAQISGMDSDFKQVVFSLGVTGTDPEHRDAFEQLMLSELGRIAREGIDPRIVEQAVKRIEFQHRELRGGIPNGLRVFMRSSRGWLHGLDPRDTLEFAPVMERLKKLVARVSVKKNKKHSRQGYLEHWIQRHLIENMHRAVVVVRPDVEHVRQMEKRLGKQLAAVEQKLSKKDMKRLADEQRAFIAYQQRPDDPEDLEAIPSLTREDLPSEIRKLDVITEELGGAPYYRQELFTNGITYADLAFDLDGLNERQLMLLTLFSRLIYMTSLPGLPYDEVSRLLAEKTGGFGTRLDAGTQKPLLHLVVRLKVLSEDAGDALSFVTRLLLEAELGNTRRIRDVVRELRSDFVSQIVPGGSSYAAMRAASHLSPAAAQEESWRGLSQWFFLRELSIENQKALTDLAAELEEIRALVFTRKRLSINLTCQGEDTASMEELLDRAAGQLPAGGQAAPRKEPEDQASGTGSFDEAFLLPSQVGFTAFSCRTAGFNTPEQVWQSLLLHLLKTNVLWDSVRMLGGAYGASASLDSIEEYCTFASYRDPRLAATFADYRRAVEGAAGGAVTPRQIELSVISLVGSDVRPLSPGEKGYLGFRRALYGITNEMREQRRNDLLAVNRERVEAAAAALLEQMDGTVSSVVLCSRQMLEKDKAALPGCYEHAVSLPL